MKTAEDLRKEAKVKLDLILEENKLAKDKLEEYHKSDKFKKEKKELLDNEISKVVKMVESQINKIILEKDSNISTSVDIRFEFFKSSLLDIKDELIKLGYNFSEEYCDARNYGDFPYNSYYYISIDLKMFLQQQL